MRRAARILLLSLALLGLASGTALAHDSALHAPAPPSAYPAPAHEDTIQELNVDLAGIVARSASAMATTSAAALPVTWCGDERTSDDTADAVHAGSLPQFKLVYAYPSDRANRFAQWKDALQANVSLIGQFVAQQSGGRKAPRWDMGTRCGPQYADITVVRLPRTRAVYAENFGEVANDVTAALGTSGMRTPVVLADHLSNRGQYSLFGQGTIATGPEGWRPDAGNAGNHEPGFTTIWASGAYVPPADSSAGYWPEGFLHEMSHNMGAVQWSAPHTSSSHPRSSAYSHCWDGYDVMCYADGPSMGHAYETSHCAQSVGAAIPRLLDCGRDDYFHPAPAAGSYLDTHWNMHDSVFLGECPSLGSMCATATGPPVSGMPGITGTARQGSTLSMTAGAWPADAAVGVRWQREGEFGNWVDIPGATGSSHLAGAADAGVPLRVRVTASDDSGTSVVHSLPTRPIEASSGVPVNTSPPQMSGRLRHGQTLHVHPGSWSSANRTLPRWERLDESSGEWQTVSYEAAYTVQPGDIDRFLRLTVTATNAVGSATASSPSRFVALGADPGPIGLAPPRISGPLTAGSTLTGFDGGWTGAERVSVEWQRYEYGAWVATGVSATSLPTTPRDAGARLRLSVVATSATGTAKAQSVAVQLGAPAPPVSVRLPAVTGVAQEGRVLTASSGEWDGAVQYTFRWERQAASGWAVIDGATTPAYTTGAADVGKALRAVVTASNAEGAVTAASPATAPVERARPPVNTVAPEATLAESSGLELTAAVGSWTGADRYVFQWQRATGDGWTDVPGATGGRLALAGTDRGTSYRVVVTAINEDGRVGASSPAVTVPLAPVAAPAPEEAAAPAPSPPLPSPAPVRAPVPAPAPAPQPPAVPVPISPPAPAPGSGSRQAPAPAPESGRVSGPVAAPLPEPRSGPDASARTPGLLPASTPVTLRLAGRSKTLAVRLEARADGGRLVLTLRNRATTLRDGRYRLRACAGRTCTTKTLVVRRRRATLPRTTLPSSARVFTVELVGKGVRGRARATRR